MPLKKRQYTRKFLDWDIAKIRRPYLWRASFSDCRSSPIFFEWSIRYRSCPCFYQAYILKQSTGSTGVLHQMGLIAIVIEPRTKPVWHGSQLGPIIMTRCTSPGESQGVSEAAYTSTYTPEIDFWCMQVERLGELGIQNWGARLWLCFIPSPVVSQRMVAVWWH